MKISELCLLSDWTIIRDDSLNPNIPIEYQLDILVEDIFQVYRLYNNSTIIIDLGWYGEEQSINGIFKIYVLKNYDWDSPIFEYSSKEIVNVLSILTKISQLINSLIDL